MRYLAIDPGNTQSAYVFLSDAGEIGNREIAPNDDVLAIVVAAEDPIIIEMVQAMGMAVGKEVFETVWWIGRFCEAAPAFHRVFRTDVKMHLCGNMRAKDKNIRQAVIDKVGPQGTKKNPGPTYGFKADMWSALAVGITWLETKGKFA